jgi:hypothetical protein
MKFYNLLFVGLFQLADRTEYKGISEYVASFGLALIIELNLIVIIGLTALKSTLLKPYILIPFYILTITLNVRYYNYNKVNLDKVSSDLKDKHRPNMTSGELIAVLMIVEAALAPLIFGLTRQ